MNPFNAYLIPAMMAGKHSQYSFGAWGVKNSGGYQNQLSISILLQMTKFQKCWLPESLLYKCTLLIDVQSTGNTFIISWKFSFTEQLHSTTFVWQSTSSRATHIFLDSFLVLKIMLI